MSPVPPFDTTTIPGTLTSGSPSLGVFTGAAVWAVPLALVLAAGTLVRFGFTANGVGWAVAQVVIVALAACDVAVRRLPNLITIPGSVVAVGLRAVFARSELAEVAIAGVVALLVFGVLAVAVRGGLGMGDVKLAGLLGFLLGSAVAPALVIGTALGGVVALALLAASRANLQTQIAYGQYLALGGAVAILGFHPPSIV
jgi:leader peptidase (prepilin peptidase) / N-methyltransferase